MLLLHKPITLIGVMWCNYIMSRISIIHSIPDITTWLGIMQTKTIYWRSTVFRSLLVLHWFTASKYPFGMFKKMLEKDTLNLLLNTQLVHEYLVQYGSSELGHFCGGGKIVLFIFPAVGRLFNMAGFTLYYVPLNDLNWTLMQENIKK